jgi:hypothetical protein
MEGETDVNFFKGKGGFHNFLVIGQSKGPLQKKTHQNMHQQLINMDLQESIFIKGVYQRYNKFIYKLNIYNIKTLSLFINKVRFKKYIEIKREGGNSKNHQFL